jgi:hypothetical protein
LTVALRNSQPLKWVPTGVSDTLDATNTANGLMSSLADLIPDQTTRGVWVCRPASLLQTSFATFNTPGFVSAMFVVGTRIYGMIGSARNAGKDEPFCWDTNTAAFVTITGVLNVNSPVSQASVGAWTPPRMALIGVRIVVCHPGFLAIGVKVGFIDVTNPAAPAWSAGDTAPIALVSVPVDVFGFNGRAYFAVNTATAVGVQYSDVLVPQTITNATQAITLDAVVPVTALGGVALSAPNVGGAIACMIIFQGVTTLYQILGDAATGTLQKNRLAYPTGTYAANSVCTTSVGLAFLSPEGIRVVDQQGSVSDPIGVDGQGIAVPFQYAVVPSRVAGACNGSVLRMSVQNGNMGTTPNQEYWYDIARKNWSGPHSFAASLLAPLGNTFAKTAIGVNAKLFTSDARQSLTSGYIENGVQMTWSYASVLMPDTDSMAETAVIEGTIDMQYPSGLPAFLGQVYDQNGTLYDSISLAPGGVQTFWGGFNWGAAIWFGTANALVSRPLSWHQELVFRRAAFAFSGQSAGSFKIGALRLRYRILRYLQQTTGG